MAGVVRKLREAERRKAKEKKRARQEKKGTATRKVQVTAPFVQHPEVRELLVPVPEVT